MEGSSSAWLTKGFGELMMQPMNELFKQQILFITDLEKIIGKDRLTLRRWWSDGKFPKPVKLHGTTLAWHKDVIDSWIDQHVR